MSIPQDAYDKLAAEIHSDTSPVGIDAKKTHILILHKLNVLEEKIAQLEARLAEKE